MKRFTETTKWGDPWFRKLTPKFKALWLYLVDSCDLAGVWDTDLENAAFHIGDSFSEDESLEAFKGRVQKLTNGRWLIPKFVAFQYGTLNPENNCHKGVIKSLEMNRLEAHEGLIRALIGPMDKDKRKEKDQGTVKSEGEPEGKQFPQELDTPEFHELWRRWAKHRIEIRKKMTDELEQSSLKKLAKAGLVVASEIIEYTLYKGWQGLADEEQVKGDRNNHGNQNTNGQRSAGQHQSERTAAKAAANEREGLASPVIKL